MHSLLTTSFVIALLPLFSFILNILNQRILKVRAHLVGIPIMLFAFVLVVYVLSVKLKIDGILDYTFNWIDLGSLIDAGPILITSGLMLDNLSVILLFVIVLVSTLVHLFSNEFMKGDTNYPRYYAFLGLSTFSLIASIIANNFLGLYAFLELAAFSNYFLIAHRYSDVRMQIAGKRYLLLNLIGSLILWVALLILFDGFQSFAFRDILNQTYVNTARNLSVQGLDSGATLTVVGLLFLIGSFIKGAQFPLHVWLCDAIEIQAGSAVLTHAASMVAVSAYVMLRVFPLLTADVLLTLALAGSLASLFAILIALSQHDIKVAINMIAVSQLGIALAALGAGAYAAAVLLTVSLVFAASSMLLCAASVIRLVKRAHLEVGIAADPQDMQTMGGLYHRMPIVAYTFLAAGLSLVGVPLVAGYLAKDEVLTGIMAYANLEEGYAIALPYIILGVFVLTALAVLRIVFLVFFGRPRSPHISERLKEPRQLLVIPAGILSLLCLWIWYSPNPFNSYDGWFTGKWIETPGQITPKRVSSDYGKAPHAVQRRVKVTRSVVQDWGLGVPNIPTRPSDPILQYSPLMEHQEVLMAERQKVSGTVLPFLLGAVGIGCIAGWLLFRRSSAVAGKFAVLLGPLYRFNRAGWRFDRLYDYLFVDTFMLFSRGMLWFDQVIIDGANNLIGNASISLSRVMGWIDRYVVDGIVNVLSSIAQLGGLFLRSVQTGKVQTYMAWTVGCVVLTFLLVRYVIIGL